MGSAQELTIKHQTGGEKMKISGRSIYTVLVAVPVLWAVSQPAYALLCTRYSLDHSGFVDIATAAS